MLNEIIFSWKGSLIMVHMTVFFLQGWWGMGEIYFYNLCQSWKIFIVEVLSSHFFHHILSPYYYGSTFIPTNAKVWMAEVWRDLWRKQKSAQLINMHKSEWPRKQRSCISSHHPNYCLWMLLDPKPSPSLLWSTPKRNKEVIRIQWQNFCNKDQFNWWQLSDREIMMGRKK